MILLVAGLGGVNATATDWPMWRYDAGHTAASPDDLPDELHLQWIRRYSPRVPVWDDPLNQDMMPYDRAFEPVVAGGRMFVGFNDADKLAALDVESGAELWTFFADGPIRFSPVAWRDNVYFTSDDGHLYCVGASDGKLRWRARGGPSAQKVIGNRRVISAWPARGGPVLRDGTVYFAASIWPFMGTFIYALDAEDGRVAWVNDGTSAEFIKQPHGAPAFAGVAPQGQLTAAANVLLVPGGRSGPAAFDRKTGRQLYFQLGGKGQGGSFVAADESRFFLHTRVRGTMACKLSDGLDAAFRVNEPVLADGMVYAANTPGEKDGQPAPAVVQAFDTGNELVWQIEADGRGDLIKAGRRLYAAGLETIVAVDLPEGERKARIAWSIPVEGEVVRLLAADDRLFAVTLDGRIMCFGPGKKDVKTLIEKTSPGQLAPEATTQADRLLAACGVDDGYALWLGVGDGQLLEAVAARSRIHVVAVDPNADTIARLRRRLDRAGLYGRRVTIHQGDPVSFKAPPYVASLIVIGESAVEGLSDEKVLAEVYRSVRPYGGRLWIPVSHERGDSLAEMLRAAKLPKAEIAVTDRGLIATRQGALPGAADWTHAYGDAANTVKSNDRLVRLPLGLLWFGGNSNTDVLPRHSHGPSEQVIGGRLFIEGMNCLSARDVYTGRVLWNRRFEDLGTFDVYYDESYDDTPLSTGYNQVHLPGANARGTNYVATEEGVYLALESECLLLDAATGETRKRFRLPSENGQMPPLWGFIGVYENLLLAGTGFADYSRRLDYTYTPEGRRGTAWGPDRNGSLGLLAFDRRSGKVLWKVDARHSFLHNGIVAGGGRVYCLDKLPKRVEDHLRRRGADDPAGYRIVALDANGGRPLWEMREDVFGTWLGYSEEHDVLIQAGSAASDRSPDEVGRGLAAYRAADGSLTWQLPDLSYAGPCILHNDAVITNTTSYQQSKGGFSLLDGSPIEIANPITGRRQPWRFTRAYGCNTAVASECLLTFRSGAAGFYDLTGHSGTGNFGGFKSGCSSNLIVANGVLNAPDYTRTCMCRYQNQTSLALVHMPQNETWTYSLLSGPDQSDAVIRRLGVNFGAPGDRRADDGTLWLDYPSVGGDSPQIALDVEGSPAWFRRHASRISGEGPPWIGASGSEGLRRVVLRVAPQRDGHFVVPVAHGDDDAEEGEIGSVRLTSSDLELTEDDGKQTVGIRFASVPVPQGARVKRAYVQFEVDEPSRANTALAIQAQLADDAPRFTIRRNDLSSREIAKQGVVWKPKPWSRESAAGPDQQTPNLSLVLQEVFDRPGWKSGNAVALFFRGFGDRVAKAYNRDPERAPKLVVELERSDNGSPAGPTRSYTVRLYFVEPDESVRPGERVFDVAVQGETVLRRFDVVDQTGGSFRSIVKSFPSVPAAETVEVKLTPLSNREPVLCGLEVVEESR
jgi:outer membrane protein assembly factor BamB